MINKDYNIITIVRVLTRPNGAIIGRLFINDEPYCYTLENASLCIPLGEYSLSLNRVSPRFSSMKFWREFNHGKMPYLDVPNRNGILIHSGNVPSDSKGCILVGEYYPNDKYGANRIVHSKDTFVKFYNYISKFKYPIKVYICKI